MRPTAKEIRAGRMKMDNIERANRNKATVVMAHRTREVMDKAEQAQQVVAESLKENESKIVANRYQKGAKHVQVEHFAKPGHTKVG